MQSVTASLASSCQDLYWANKFQAMLKPDPSGKISLCESPNRIQCMFWLLAWLPHDFFCTFRNVAVNLLARPLEILALLCIAPMGPMKFASSSLKLPCQTLHFPKLFWARLVPDPLRNLSLGLWAYIELLQTASLPMEVPKDLEHPGDPSLSCLLGNTHGSMPKST